MSDFPKRRCGAPPGNFNALKHGFYTRRLKKHDLTGVESTDTSGLAEEIALIRVFTRRLIETCTIDADVYDLAELLRVLCLASSTITRVIKTQYLISSSGYGINDEISEAIRQVNAELRGKLPASDSASPASTSSTLAPPDLPVSSFTRQE